MKGVLLVNLGSPKSTSPEDVKAYLDEFLMDPLVFDFPYILRSAIVRGIILKTRPKQSAEAYEKIWTEEGSPLIVNSERFKKRLQELLNLPISLAMRYGNMNIANGLEELVSQGVTKILLIPLYPQYAMSTVETIVLKVSELVKKNYPNLIIDRLPVFYKQSDYISILSQQIHESLDGVNYDHLLFSYHGLPTRHIKKRDLTGSHCKLDENCCYETSVAHDFCYRHQCFATTQAVAKTLNLKPQTYSNAFQSRLGIDPWLEPFTASEVKKLAQNGVKNLAVVSPAFVSDCLETLEEIAMEAKEFFIAAGGENLIFIPCLNDRADWVQLMAKWISEWELEPVFL